uniref:WW domain binding protein VOPP1 n=1 Tax=Salmo trutta TaxID=8032 RepID=A0A673VKB9_SALTR
MIPECPRSGETRSRTQCHYGQVAEPKQNCFGLLSEIKTLIKNEPFTDHYTIIPGKELGRCRSYEDCCGTRCCVRALSIQRLWYFWLMLMMGVLFCCGAGIFFRRCIHPSPLSDEHAFNVSFTRQPVSTPVSQQPGMVGYGDPGGVMTSPLTPIHPGPAHTMNDYPPPPSYCNHPPPPYEQIFRTPEKK